MQTDNAGSTGAADDLDLFEAEATGQAATKAETNPSKYEGKSVDDLINMHANAEKLISRQGQELGQMRRYADELINLKKPTTETKKEAHQPVTVEQLLNDPERALRSAVDSSDLANRAARAEEAVARLERKITERDFVAKHTTFADDINDPEFTSWVAKNPARAALGKAAADANQPGQYEAATSLWDMWTERNEMLGNGAKEQKTDSSTKRKVPTAVRQAPADVRGKTNYSRSKLMELRMKVQDGDPAATARWNDPKFQANLIKAYEEDRVV